MEAQEGSPNWYWQKLGCTITRGGGDGSKLRTITNEDGEVVYSGYPCDYDIELNAAQVEFNKRANP